ncbi:hypothetical protein HIO71_16040 [Chryseobacterium aquaticum]|uniref:Uncharacterized protein n=1 Tax=Chryseobacterium aquaticum TaxID=452084 RepID=A0A848NBE7_9FLAO|nr:MULTISPECIES: hypothetical protein [Chryseobacterium]NMR35689.1 hypothetical protein [Chryseobacterium aquaticum]NRQ47864.1 hypothetical protein [Chryseobacterium sp. C-204]
MKEIEIDNIIDEEGVEISEEELLVNKKYTFDLAWTSLRRYNFYTTCDDFVKFNNKNKSSEFYILEIDCTEKENSNYFIKNYNDLLSIKEFITEIADDNFHEKSIIYSENRYLKINNNITSNMLSKKDYTLGVGVFETFLDDYDKVSKEIKAIFKSELINFLNEINEDEKLGHLFLNFSEFYKRCIIGYEYYLKDFSYNKVKAELDNSVLDFSKNIRNVVNDSQNKLIIIPAAIVLAFSTFEVKEPFNIKNIFVLISSVLFAYMMDSFVKNQTSALVIIKININNYKDIFLDKSKSKISNLNEIILKSFLDIDIELKRQEKWMLGIRRINWMIPILLFFFLLSLIYNMRRH